MHRFSSDTMMARVEFTLKVVTFGDKKPFVNNYLFIDGDEAAHHLRTVIKNEVNKAKDGIVFNAADDEISEIIGSGGVNIASMLDRPVYLFPPKFKEVSVKIYSTPPSQGVEEDENVVDLVVENKVVMTFLKPKYSMEHVTDFQNRFEKRSGGRQSFLQSNSDTPTYEDQIDTAIKHIMEHPENGMRPCGHKERLGDKKFREEQFSDAEAAANNLEVDESEEPKKKKVAKIVISTECSNLQSAVRQIRDCFKYVHDHRTTLKSRDASQFNTPILNAIGNADPDGTHAKHKRKMKQMTQLDLKKQLGKINDASRALPKWYHKKITESGTVRKGEVLVHELENLRLILKKHLSHLNNQNGLNFFGAHKNTGTKPNHTNTDMNIMNRQPFRPTKSKRSDSQKDIYARADAILKKVENGAFYTNLSVTDVALGIDGPEWDGGREGLTRRSMRSKIIAQLGSDRLRYVQVCFSFTVSSTNF